MEPILTCGLCGREISPPEQYEVGGKVICPDCAEEHTVVCRHCGERIWREQNQGDEDLPLCSDCYYDYYSQCCRCGRIMLSGDMLYLDDEDDCYCPSCYAAVSDEVIHSYSYKPEPVFHGADSRYYGVELELDGAGERTDRAAILLEIGNQGEDRLYAKHDGSLNDGFELVSHPMTLSYHREEMPWQQVLERAVRFGYLSHKANTCGLHIHVNRSAFGDTRQQQEASIGRALFFVETHWNELLRFSRRTQRQMERWAARYGRKDDPKQMLDHAKSCHAGRYACVNLTNEETVEFRMFRGTLRYGTLIAALQLVDAICEAATSLTDEEIQDLSWSGFVASLDGADVPELITYLKERRLYVNAPVGQQEEV